MNYTTQKLVPGKLNDLHWLHKKSFNSKYDFTYFKDKYNTQAYHEDLIGFFSYADETPAAYYGIFPIALMYNGTKVIASQSGDTMTHPDHRGKGLFVDLAKKTYQFAGESGIKFVLGFTNTKSHRGFEKLGWTFTGKWKVFTIENKLPDTSIVFRKFPFLKRIFTNWLKKYVVKFDQIKWESFIPEGVKGYVLKDSDFFEYKKYSNAQLVSIDGFHLYLNINPYLLLGDVSYFPYDKMPAFLAVLQKIAKKSLVKKVSISISENHWLTDYFNKSGFTPQESSSTIGYYNFSTDHFDFKSIMHIQGDADYF